MMIVIAPLVIVMIIIIIWYYFDIDNECAELLSLLPKLLEVFCRHNKSVMMMIYLKTCIHSSSAFSAMPLGSPFLVRFLRR